MRIKYAGEELLTIVKDVQQMKYQVFGEYVNQLEEEDLNAMIFISHMLNQIYNFIFIIFLFFYIYLFNLYYLMSSITHLTLLVSIVLNWVLHLKANMTRYLI